MVQKIEASVVILITALLAIGLLIAENINNDSKDTVNQPVILSKINLNNQAIPISGCLVINELMADNDQAVRSAFGGYPDWIELYNSGNTSIDLSRMYLTDNLSKPQWRFPNGTIILPHSYLLVWADADAGASTLQVNFNLLANGGVIGLFSSDKTMIDFVLYDKQIRDVSYGRVTDGSLGWDYMTTSTPGKANIQNSNPNNIASWETWLFISLALTACVLVVVKGKNRWRRR